MKELFYEETAVVQNERSATIKYNIFKATSITFYALTIVWVLIFFNFYLTNFSNIIADIIVFLIPCLALFFSGFFIGKFKNRFYVDYDYTFVSGSIRISKVIKNVKRKFVLEFDTYSIEKIGKYNSDTYFSYANLLSVKKEILTSNEYPANGKEFYYIVANVNGEKNLLIFECSEEFIISILKFSNKTVLEEELLKR